MGLDKNEGKSDVKNKVTGTTVNTKKIPTNVFQMAKGRSERIPRLKLQRPKTQPATSNGTLIPQRSVKQHTCVIPEVVMKNPSSCTKPKIHLKRKSISLEAFSNNSIIWRPEQIYKKEQGHESKTPSMIDQKRTFTFSSSTKESELAKKVCKVFFLHAWRKRRMEVAELKNRVQKLDSEVQNQNISIVVLKYFLDSEKLRLNVALSDSAHLRDRLAAEISEGTNLKKSLNQLESDKFALEGIEKKLEADISVLKNHLGITNGVVKHTREVFDETRRELVTYRGKEVEILSQLGETEARLRDVVLCLEDERKKSASLQVQMTKLTSKNQSLIKEKDHKEKEIHECIIEINKRDDSLNNLQNTQNVENENIDILTKEIAVTRNKIKEQSHTIQSLEEIVSQYETEKEERDRNMFTIRNQVVFGGIQRFAKMLFPNQPL